MRTLSGQGGSDIDQVLAQGMSKLESFGRLMTLYQEWAGDYPNATSPDSLIDEYLQQEGMSVAGLRAYASTLSSELTSTLTDQATDQQAKLAQLQTLWTNSAAATAATYAQSQASTGISTGTTSLATTSTTVGAAADTLEQIVTAKVTTIQQYLTDSVAGKSADQISQLIGYAKNGFGGASTEEAGNMLRAILPEYPGGSDV
ncbi:hypothetical protein ACFVMC_25010 [Nocardia sp. NPDC127579]|uniref:hypothetical protein n=1 Tax=Nocardia sp. NPDC127579 TaxID=3345402 RepID=UPI003629933C